MNPSPSAPLCARLRLSSGYPSGCLSSTKRPAIPDALALPDDAARGLGPYTPLTVSGQPVRVSLALATVATAAAGCR